MLYDILDSLYINEGAITKKRYKDIPADVEKSLLTIISMADRYVAEKASKGFKLTSVKLHKGKTDIDIRLRYQSYMGINPLRVEYHYTTDDGNKAVLRIDSANDKGTLFNITINIAKTDKSVVEEDFDSILTDKVEDTITLIVNAFKLDKFDDVTGEKVDWPTLYTEDKEKTVNLSTGGNEKNPVAKELYKQIYQGPLRWSHKLSSVAYYKDTPDIMGLSDTEFKNYAGFTINYNNRIVAITYNNYKDIAIKVLKGAFWKDEADFKAFVDYICGPTVQKEIEINKEASNARIGRFDADRKAGIDSDKDWAIDGFVESTPEQHFGY